jgi:hypothetical protein
MGAFLGKWHDYLHIPPITESLFTPFWLQCFLFILRALKHQNQFGALAGQIACGALEVGFTLRRMRQVAIKKYKTMLSLNSSLGHLPEEHANTTPILGPSVPPTAALCLLGNSSGL